MKTVELEKLLQMTINKNGFEAMPLVSHICGNLYVGVSPCYWPGGIENFRVVFNLYTFEEYLWMTPGRWPLARHVLTLRDSELEGAMRSTLEKMADDVNEACTGGPALVHCQMGVNRSNLVAGLALIRSGISPAEAIALLRTRRSDWVLMNDSFSTFLLNYKRKKRK